MLTLTLMLVRRKSACKTSAGSSKIFRWLAPLLGPNLDPKTGHKQRPKRRNENVIQFWTPFLGSIFGPKNGVSHRRISLLPANVLQADLRPSLNMTVNTYLFLFVRPKAACYCTKNKLGRTEREKACVNTYAHASASQICLQNICGQQQNFPMAGPTFGSKSGPQNGAQAKT